MEHFDKICEFVEEELGSIARNGQFRSREEIDAVGKMIDMIKDIYEIEEMEDGQSYAYRYPMNSYRGGSYRDGRSYEGGRSYARGRGRNARRDSMGRYSREGGSYGYSRAEDKMEYIENLRELMETAPDENTRMSIQRMIQSMEQMQ